jgi:hypothetical protein
MTRSLKKVPDEIAHSFYGLRAGKPYRLAGSLPEKIEALVRHGAKVSDALCFFDVVERHVMEIVLARAPRPLEDSWADTADAEQEVNLATLRLAAHPHEKARIDAAIDALNRLCYAVKIEVATLAKQGASL